MGGAMSSMGAGPKPEDVLAIARNPVSYSPPLPVNSVRTRVILFSLPICFPQ